MSEFKAATAVQSPDPWQLRCLALSQQDMEWPIDLFFNIDNLRLDSIVFSMHVSDVLQSRCQLVRRSRSLSIK